MEEHKRNFDVKIKGALDSMKNKRINQCPAFDKYEDIRIGWIYKFNVGGRIYYGKASNVNTRLRGHKSSLFNPNRDEYNKLLYKCIRENNYDYTIEIVIGVKYNTNRQLLAAEGGYINPIFRDKQLCLNKQLSFTY